MGRRDRQAPELSRVYEGAEVLGACLEAAGSTMPIAVLKDVFAAAQQEGAVPGEVFVALFAEEPRFESPEAAKRLYQNLFGLWDRVARGDSGEPVGGRPVAVEKPAPLPPPDEVEGTEIPEAFVQAALGALATLAEKERAKQRDRFEQRESAACERIRLLQLSAAGEEAALELAFELWLLCTWALGARAGRTDFARLGAGELAPAQPALGHFVGLGLGEAELDDDEPLSADERARIEPLLHRVAAMLAPA